MRDRDETGEEKALIKVLSCIATKDRDRNEKSMVFLFLQKDR